MDEAEFAEVFAACVKDSLPTGWEILALDIGELEVTADHGRIFRLSISIEEPEA